MRVTLNQVQEILPFHRQQEYLDQTYKKSLRWFMLLLCILFITSVWFCIDYPASLEKNIETGFNVSETKYGLLYTFFAIPNCIMPLIGGIFFDKLGTRNGLMLFTFVVCIGQGLLMLGGYNMSFNTLLIGRIVFGVGCEAMIVG